MVASDIGGGGGAMDSLSFRPQGSYRAGKTQPILSEDAGNDRRDFVVKIDGGGSESGDLLDLPNPNFTSTAAASGGDKEVRRRPSDDFSFRGEINDGPSKKKPSSHVAAGRKSASSSSDDDNGGGGTAEVLRCTSNSYRRNSTLLRAKTRSRLMDPPPLPPVAEDRKSGGMKSPPRSRQLRPGRPSAVDEEDEDPFLDEDNPFSDDDRSNGRRHRPLVVLQWLSLLLLLSSFACTLAVPALRHRTLWSLSLWRWEVLVLVLICGHLVSGWAVRVAVFLLERRFLLLRRRVLYFVYGLRRAVQNCLWLGLVLLAWTLLFDSRVERETSSPAPAYVSRVLLCLLVAALFRLAKTLLLKVLASSFHVSTYFDRIQEALFNQYVIGALSGPPIVELRNAREEEDRLLRDFQELQSAAGAAVPDDLRKAATSPAANGAADRRPWKAAPKEDGGISVEQLYRLNQKNVSAWSMKRLMKIVRRGTLSTLDERMAAAGGVEDESAMRIRSEIEAKAAAKKIFINVAKPGARYIYLADLMRFLKEDEAEKTMDLFEGAQEKNRVSKKALKNWVVNVFRERRALSLTLNDTKTAVNKLHQMANVVVAVIVLAIWLIILGIATTHLFVFISSQLLLVTFVFGNTLKMVFEAIIFLFVMHPFDVGDRCEIKGVQMIVEEMNILTTVFLRYDNQKIICPNSVLAAMPIGNIYRSPDMRDTIDFCVHVSTPVEKLAIMKERIKRFIESKKEHWYPDPEVTLRDVDEMNRLTVTIWLRHRTNYQDMVEIRSRRDIMVQEMIRVLRELGIEYPVLPLDVNVRHMPASNSTRLPSTWTSYSQP